MTILLQFLALVLPKTPELVALFREAFQKVGGDPAQFDAILAENQIQIDRLGDPDSFRHRPASKPTPSGEFPYTELLTAYPDESRLKSGDEIYQLNTEQQFIVWGGLGRKPDAAGWHLVKTMP